MKLFQNRAEAGRLLASRLKNTQADLVLGIPRGGVVVAKEVAKELGLPLDIVITRKIGAPTQPELALGAVNPDGEVVWDNQLLEQLEFKISNLKFEIENEMREIRRREQIYRQGKKPLNVINKAVILIDDGIATGATVISAIEYLKSHGVEKIIMAAPVVSKATINRIIKKVGELEAVVLEEPLNFQAVGQFYEEFLPVADEEVVQLLKDSLFGHKKPFD